MGAFSTIHLIIVVMIAGSIFVGIPLVIFFLDRHVEQMKQQAWEMPAIRI